MADTPKRLADRPGYQEDHDQAHPLTAGLRDLVEKNNLHGAVLLTFYGDSVGVNANAGTPLFRAVMQRLADRLLQRLDDGDFDDVLAGVITHEAGHG